MGKLRTCGQLRRKRGRFPTQCDLQAAVGGENVSSPTTLIARPVSLKIASQLPLYRPSQRAVASMSYIIAQTGSSIYRRWAPKSAAGIMRLADAHCLVKPADRVFHNAGNSRKHRPPPPIGRRRQPSLSLHDRARGRGRRIPLRLRPFAHLRRRDFLKAEFSLSPFWYGAVMGMPS